MQGRAMVAWAALGKGWDGGGAIDVLLLRGGRVVQGARWEAVQLRGKGAVCRCLLGSHVWASGNRRHAQPSLWGPAEVALPWPHRCGDQ